jgi:hypothetical protein
LMNIGIRSKVLGDIAVTKDFSLLEARVAELTL